MTRASYRGNVDKPAPARTDSTKSADGIARQPTDQPDDEHARRAASFGAVAAAYAEHRPDYPAAAIGWALEHLPPRSAGRPARLLDLGAGTGKLTAGLTQLSIGGGPAEVVAVEPDQAMLTELRRRLPGVTALAGQAESIPLPDGCMDAVLVGQAAHWFDLQLAVPEIARVLVPDGVLAALWNADDDREDLVAGLHRVTGNSSAPKFSSVPQSGEVDELTGWLGPLADEFFRPDGRSGFGHAQVRTADSMIETLRTQSKFLIMEPAEREAVLARVRIHLAATPQTRDGEFSWPIHTFAVRAIRR
jgi:SAM-dependent methyltransferase